MGRPTDPDYLDSDEEDYDIPPFLHLEFRNGIHVIPVRRKDPSGNRMGLLKTLRAPFKCREISLPSHHTRKGFLEKCIADCKERNALKTPDKNEINIVWLRNQTVETQPTAVRRNLPLIPDFSDFAAEIDFDIPKLNLSREDRLRTEKECENRKKNFSPAEPDEQSATESISLMDISISPPNTQNTCQSQPVMEKSLSTKPSVPPKRPTAKTLPPDIREKMWPHQSKCSDSETVSNKEDREEGRKSTLEDNLKVLQKRPLDSVRLAEIREKVTRGIDKLRILEESNAPPKKKVKIEPVVWDLGDSDTTSDDTKKNFNSRFKNMKVTDLSGNPSPRKRRVTLSSEKQVTDLSDNPSPRKRMVIMAFDKQGNFHKTWVKGEPIDTPPTEPSELATAYQSKIKGREILTAKRKRIIRCCRICGVENKNLKAHLASEHLGSVWWGVLGDQTCWQCQDYHYPGGIAKCDGAYIPILHRSQLEARHTEFLDFLKEDFGVKTVGELIDTVRNLGLHTRSVSEFSEREIYFLREIDKLYFLPQKPQHSAIQPTRISELLHWKTLTEIMVYLSEAGNISGGRVGGKVISLTDSSCDVQGLFTKESHCGTMIDLPLIQRELQMYSVNSIIGEISDPSVSTEEIQEVLSDPLVRVCFGVKPSEAGNVTQEYYDVCFKEVRNVRVAGIGGLGIDIEGCAEDLAVQKQVMSDYIDLAMSCSKAIRVYSTGDLDESLNLLSAKVEPAHPIHLLNFNKDLETAESFLDRFENGYIGISTQICDPDPALLETVRQIPIEKLILESNCPDQVISYQAHSKPTDIVKILNTISVIKGMHANVVAKIMRGSINKLYHF